MYESHFGLSGRPFGETVGPSAYVALPSRTALLRRLGYALEHGGGPVVMFGPPGAGKTLLARVFAVEFGGPSAHLVFPAMPTEELLAFLADELGAEPGGDTALVTSLRRLRRWLAATRARGERPTLIVDEAHLIDDPRSFESLRLLLNFSTTGPPDLSLVLVGGPELLLRLPPSLADRTAARCLLGPLTHSETSSYVLGRLSAAGASAPLFDVDALALLHRAAGGLPRRLNRLADLALLIACADGLPRPDCRAVEVAERELDFESAAA